MIVLTHFPVILLRKLNTEDQKQHLAGCRPENVTNTSYSKNNPLEFIGNHSATSNNMKLVHWPLMLHLVQPQPAQAPPRCTKCNSPAIDGQCINHCIAV